MFKKVAFYGSLNERTGYGVHASRFTEALAKLIPVSLNTGEGDVHVAMLDTVTASNVKGEGKRPAVLYNVWESTEYPQGFINNLKYFDQLWVASEWQRASSLAQGIPEEFVKVVPEGVDPEIYKPDRELGLNVPRETFTFVHVGQWQPRKSTQEIIESFIKAFPADQYPNVRLELSVDTLFPSDNYKSTEERLEAYGLHDERIIVIHFEERKDYIRRLQRAHCFVSCSRSEGWGLPIIEAMGCGVPVIVADWSGSTEYARDAIRVPIRKLIKPFGIYGNWEVPGQWCEPDFDQLVEILKDVYANYSGHKEKALKTSDYIRGAFAWEMAASKAVKILGDLHERLAELPEDNPVVVLDKEAEIRSFAAKRDYVIESIRKRKAIFELECWPSTDEKLRTLIETIEQVHTFGYPVIISSHFPLPDHVVKMVEYYLYDKRDIMSGDDKPMYWRRRLNGAIEEKRCRFEYQGVAALNCFRNAIDFCRGKFDWIYQMNADIEVDLAAWLKAVHESDKPMICIPYEGKKDGIGGGLWAGKTEVLDRVVPYLDSWKQYADEFPDFRFVIERWLLAYIQKYHDINEIGWAEIETSNRFDNVDRELWDDDDFQIHFVGGPYLNIIGISNREYDVSYHDGESVQYSLRQKCGTWSRPNVKYYKPWTVSASLNGKEVFRHALDLKGQRVIISFGSKALGDTLAWMPYVEEFRKKHDCKVFCACWWKQIFDYPEINFINPGDGVDDVYASYDVGCFDEQLDKNVVNWRETILQKVAADILGLEYEPIRPKLKYIPHVAEPGGKPYVCISEFSTMRNKLWNREGAWQKVVDYLIEKGYDVVSISAEQTGIKGVIKHNGQSIEQTMTDISGAAFCIGLNAGPSWLAYALGIPIIVVTGVSEPWNDFPNEHRVAIDVCRPGCFNDPSIPISRGWEWCPRGKDYACTKEITEQMVFDQIDKIVKRRET